MTFDMSKLIGSRLPASAMAKEDQDYVSADRIKQWRHECKQKSTYLQHGNLISILAASVIGEPNMFFIPEKEDIVVVIANSPMIALLPEFPKSLNYAYQILWPELRPFNAEVAMRCVQECAKQLEWAPHEMFAVVMDQDEQGVEAGAPGVRIYRGCLMVNCPEHAEMNARLANTMMRAWNHVNKKED